MTSAPTLECLRKSIESGSKSHNATIGALSLVLPHPSSYETSPLWSNIALSYAGASRLFTLYVDGINRWTGTGGADLLLDPPTDGVLTFTTIFKFSALQEYRHGWEALYPVALSASQVANHALGDAGASGTSTTSPQVGQPVSAESATGDGTTTLYTTAYPYVPGSLVVFVNGVKVVVTETNPTLGTFTLPSAPPAASLITWTYNAASTTPTGTANPAPTPGVGGVPQTIVQLVNKSGGSVAASPVDRGRMVLWPYQRHLPRQARR
jgi:hypothetical protein